MQVKPPFCCCCCCYRCVFYLLFIALTCSTLRREVRSWWLSTCLPSSLSTLVRLFVLSVYVLCFTLNGFSCSLFLTVKGYFAPLLYFSSSFIYLIFLSFLFLSPFSFSLSLYFFLSLISFLPFSQKLRVAWEAEIRVFYVR